MYCELSRRQRLWYNHLKRKITWQELREAAFADGSSTTSGSAAAKTLMNIMMQMRKICNHPDLMEKRDVQFLCMAPALDPLRWPKLVFRECGLEEGPAWRYGLVLHPSRASALLQALSLLTGLSPTALFAWSCWGPSLPLLLALLRAQEHAATARFVRRLRAADTTPPSAASDEASVLRRQRDLAVSLLAAAALPLHPANAQASPALRECSSFVRGGCLAFLDFKILSRRSVRTLRCMAGRVPPLLGRPLVSKVLARPCPPYCVDAAAARLRAALLRPAAALPVPGLTRCELVDFRTRIADSGKMQKLDELLRELKADGHRVLIYSQVRTRRLAAR